MVWHDLLDCNTDSCQIARETMDVHLQEQEVGSSEYEGEGSIQTRPRRQLYLEEELCVLCDHVEDVVEDGAEHGHPGVDDEEEGHHLQGAPQGFCKESSRGHLFKNYSFPY